MSKYQVFVNDEEIDVPPSQTIATTLQAVDIGSGDIVSRKASFTNQISVPKTARNVFVMGNSSNIHSTDDFPFTINTVRVLATGLQILSGQVAVKDVSDKFNLRLYSAIKDLSTALGTKTLDELDFGDSPITWNKSYWDSKRASTTGLCAPVIDYGQIDTTLTDGTIGEVYLPSVSYRDILNQIFNEAGYTLGGDFYDNDTVLAALVLTYGRAEWPGTSFKINEILSESITQIDFVKDCLIRFWGIPRFDGSDVEIVLMKDILALSSSVDWTTKRVNPKKEKLEFNWGGWAQTNIFGFAATEPGVIATDEYYQDSLSFGNENSPKSRPLYNSIFERQTTTFIDGDLPSSLVANWNVAGIASTCYCATTGIFIKNGVAAAPTTYEFRHDPKSMVCILRDPEPDTDIESQIIYNVTARTDYKIAYFNQFSSPITFGICTRWRGVTGTSEEGFLDLYYSEFEARLEKPKMVTREYRLTDIDIYSLDLLTPVFDDGDYFLINKVKDYVSGRNTEVELMRI